MERVLDFLRTDRAKLIICLLIAAVIWFINEMSKSYESEFTFTLVYQYPDNYLPTKDPPAQIRVTLTGEGWQLMKKRFKGSKDSIMINVHGTGSYYVAAQDLSFKISNFIKTDELQLSQLRQDGFNIELVPRMEKILPVKSTLTYTLPDQYGFADSLSLHPDSVTIRGPSNQLKEIEYWRTRKDDLGMIKGAFERQITLEQPDSRLIQISPGQVTAAIHSEPFTEQSFFVPLRLRDTPERPFMIFPEEVQLKFEVGMSQYEQINAEDFKIRLEKSSTVDPSSTYRVLIDDTPEKIRKLRYSPKEVELFFMESDTLQADQ